jgi:hypothetical protein
MEALTNLTTQRTFNACQVDALSYAMTHRVALIQGPPGLHFLHVFSSWCFDCFPLYKSAPHRNMHFVILISRPIQYLITFTPTQAQARHTQGCTLPATLCTRASSEYYCYTNHALDQFLEAILAHYPDTNMLSIGGKRQSKVLEPSISALNKPAHVLTVCQSQSTAACAVESTSATHFERQRSE